MVSEYVVDYSNQLKMQIFFIKNSMHLWPLSTIHSKDTSLFTNIAITEAMDILRKHHNTTGDIVKLTQEQIMESTYFI